MEVPKIRVTPPVAPNGAAAPRAESGETQTLRASGAARATDSYAVSPVRRDAARLIARLKSGEVPEVRQELVAKFRALMEAGGLDGDDAIRAAADGFLKDFAS